MRIRRRCLSKIPLGKKAARGLTLTEVILAAAIMGITAMVLLPHFIQQSYIGDLTLRTAVAEVASELRRARQLAVTNSGHYLFYMNLTSLQYGIYNGSYSASNLVGVMGTLNAGVNCSGTNQFDFYSLGNSSGSSIICAAKNSEYTISVDPTTGAVDVERT